MKFLREIVPMKKGDYVTYGPHQESFREATTEVYSEVCKDKEEAKPSPLGRSPGCGGSGPMSSQNGITRSERR